MPAPPSVCCSTPPTYPSPYSVAYCHSSFLLRAWSFTRPSPSAHLTSPQSGGRNGTYFGTYRRTYFCLTSLRLGESEVNLVRHTMAKSRLTPPAPIILCPSKLKLLSRVLCVKSTWKSREPPGRNERRASSRLSKNGIRYNSKLTQGSSSHAWVINTAILSVTCAKRPWIRCSRTSLQGVAATCVSMASPKRGAGYLNLPASTDYWQKQIPAGISYHLGACPLYQTLHYLET